MQQNETIMLIAFRAASDLKVIVLYITGIVGPRVQALLGR